MFQLTPPSVLIDIIWEPAALPTRTTSAGVLPA